MSREFSRQELYALGMPFGDGATRVKPGGRGLVYGGGGGGGVKYDNLEKLYDIQATQAQKLMDMSDKYVYPAFGDFMQEARGTGSIANQEAAAGQAAADVAAAQGGAKQQLADDLASMGVNPADQKYANTMADMDMGAAAQSAAAQTGARDKQRQLGYAKMKDAISTGMGVSSDSVSALNAASNTGGSIANLQSQQAATRAQNTGNIAALATRLMFKDGGLVKRPQGASCGGGIKRKYANGGEVKAGGVGRYAFGGFLRGAGTPPTPPATAPMPNQTRQVGNAVVGVGGTKLGAGIEKLGNLTGSSDVSAFGQGMRLGNDAQGAIDAYKGAADAATAAGQTAANSIGTATADAATQYGVSAAGEQAAMLGAQEMGMGTLATEAGAATAAAEAGGTAAALGAGSAVAAALPWVGGAMLIGSALGLFKDGGSVAKKKLAVADGTKGGKVSGPGGPKDDMVPAMLSDGEFVMPVGSVQLYGKDKLEQMRQQGLAYEKQVGIGA